MYIYNALQFPSFPAFNKPDSDLRTLEKYDVVHLDPHILAHRIMSQNKAEKQHARCYADPQR